MLNWFERQQVLYSLPPEQRVQLIMARAAARQQRREEQQQAKQREREYRRQQRVIAANNFMWALTFAFPGFILCSLPQANVSRDGYLSR